MSEKEKNERSEADAELEREIRRGRKFNLADAIGRMAGPGAMKGVSPVPRKQQAVVEIDSWLLQHMPAGHSELHAVLLRWVAGSELFLANFEKPLVVLAAFCRQVLDTDYLLKELVREADVEWGRVVGERPYFNKDGSPPHPDDPYSIEPVRATLLGLLTKLSVDDSSQA